MYRPVARGARPGGSGDSNLARRGVIGPSPPRALGSERMTYLALFAAPLRTTLFWVHHSSRNRSVWAITIRADEAACYSLSANFRLASDDTVFPWRKVTEGVSSNKPRYSAKRTSTKAVVARNCRYCSDAGTTGARRRPVAHPHSAHLEQVAAATGRFHLIAVRKRYPVINRQRLQCPERRSVRKPRSARECPPC